MSCINIQSNSHDIVVKLHQHHPQPHHLFPQPSSVLAILLLITLTMKLLFSVLALTTGTLALSVPSKEQWKHALAKDAEVNLKPRQSCENTATSRDCWGDYSIDTNYYVSFLEFPFESHDTSAISVTTLVLLFNLSISHSILKSISLDLSIKMRCHSS